jgi:hypothetical protein
MRFQLLPALRIGICERFGERFGKHRRNLGKRIRERHCERFGIR